MLERDGYGELPAADIKVFLDAAPEAMVVIGGAGRIAFVNIQAEAMFEYPRSQLIGQPIDILLPEGLRARHAQHVLDYSVAPRRRPMGSGLELFARRRDGTEFPVEISLGPVQTERGHFVCSVIRDITVRKGIEHRLIEARDVAEQQNRAKSHFLAAASHDLRQPLQTLTLLGGVLNRIVPSDSQAAAAIANQSEALRLMAELLNSLLDVSKLESGAIRPDITDCPVGAIFARFRAEFATLAEAKGLELIVEDCDDFVRTDPALLGQIIQNLLANAIRYTREGWVRLRGFVSADNVRIEVLDSGIGIPAEELELIFHEFYQAPLGPGQAREGVGLGLSIVRRMASLLGCPLEVRSAIGRGSCFSVCVPRADESVRLSEPRTGEAAGQIPAGSLVLVVDDDAAVADATAMLLGAMGLEVIVATSAEHALREVQMKGRAPNLLICDYHLGATETGIDAIQAVRAVTRRQLPAILVSGDTSSAIRAVVQSVAGCHLLSKPVDADELLENSARLLLSDRH